jgi:hypothetical protein
MSGISKTIHQVDDIGKIINIAQGVKSHYHHVYYIYKDVFLLSYLEMNLNDFVF